MFLNLGLGCPLTAEKARYLQSCLYTTNPDFNLFKYSICARGDLRGENTSRGGRSNMGSEIWQSWAPATSSAQVNSVCLRQKVTESQPDSDP